MVRQESLRRFEQALWLAGFVTLGYCSFVVVKAKVYQAYESRKLDLAISQQAAAPASSAEAHPARAASLWPKHTHGSTVGRLEIPRIGLSVMVLEGWDSRTLQLGAGHLPGSALPGQPGNVVLSGHRDTFFRPLRDIRDKDLLRLITPESTHWYEVESTTVVTPDSVQVLKASSEPGLTLITCYPFGYIGSAPKRLVVQARERSEAPKKMPKLARVPKPVAPPQAHEARAVSVEEPAPVAAKPVPVREEEPAPPPRTVVKTALAEPPAREAAAKPEAPPAPHGIKKLNPVRVFGKIGHAFRHSDRENTEDKPQR